MIDSKIRPSDFIPTSAGNTGTADRQNSPIDEKMVVASSVGISKEKHSVSLSREIVYLPVSDSPIVGLQSQYLLKTSDDELKKPSLSDDEEEEHLVPQSEADTEMFVLDL